MRARHDNRAAVLGGLVFENGDGKTDVVPAEQVGGLLAAANVPLVLLGCNTPGSAPAVASGLAGCLLTIPAIPHMKP